MARSKVNTKFVLILAGSSVLAVGGLIGLYYKLVYQSPEQYVARGDAKVAEGDPRTAIDLYGKAVGREQANPEFLTKWRDAMVAWVPPDRLRFEDMFKQYRGAMRQLAFAQRDSLADQVAYMELMRKLGQMAGPSSGMWKDIEVEADQLIAFHKDQPGTEWKKLLKYRGMSRALQAFARNDAEASTIDSAIADIDHALLATPDDTQLIILKSDLFYLKAARAFREARRMDAEAHLATSTEVIDSALAQMPDKPDLLLSKIQRTIDKARTDLSGITEQRILRERSLQVRPVVMPLLDAARDAGLSNNGAAIDALLVQRMMAFEENLDPGSRFARSEALAKAALSVRPNDAEVALMLGEIIAQRPDADHPGAHFAAAVDQMQRVLDAPSQGVGLDGLLLFSRKQIATFRQALWSSRQALMLVPAATGPSANDQSKKVLSDATQRAKGFRAKLLLVEAPDSPQVTLVDAHLAVLENDFRKANSLLVKYNKDAQSTDPDALMLTADVAIRLNQPGAARDAIARVIDLQPANLNAVFILGQIEMQLQNFVRAREIYARILEMLPDNEIAKRQLQTIALIESGQGAPTAAVGDGSLVDPVIKVLSEIEKFARAVELEPDGTTQVINMLQAKADEMNDDPRLIKALAVYKVREGNRDGAKSTLDRALAKYPDHPELRAMRAGLDHADPIEAQVAMVNAQDAPQIDKLIAIYNVYSNAGQDDKAARQLAAAVALDPNNVRIIEIQFMEALESKNFEVAKQIVDKAIASDMDSLGGLSFRARLQAAQGNPSEAANTMQQAVDRGGASPEAYRLLGRMYMLARRMPEATRSYEQALRLRPNDIPTVNDLLLSLRAANRNDEALVAARRYEKMGRADRTFIDAWLALEAGVGDKVVAITERERILRAAPDDRSNNLALVELYIMTQSWQNGRALLDRVRQKSDGLDAAYLDASWNWNQNRREEARKVLNDYIAGLGSDNKDVRPYLVYAQFLASNNDLENAASVLDRARPLQDSKTMDVDRSLVQLCLASNRIDDAIAACQRVIAGGADSTDQAFRKQLIALLQQQGKNDQAAAELAKLPTGRDADVETTLLRADAAARRNDSSAQKRILDEAVSLYPTDARVFMARGQFLLQDRQTARDAIEDFARAAQLRPDLARAFQLRAIAHSMLGDTAAALTNLEAAVTADPNDDQLFFGVVSDMLRQKEITRANQVTERVIALRTPTVPVLVQLGDIYRAFSHHDSATRLYRRAWDLETEKSDALSQRILDSMMDEKPPRVQDADLILRSLGTDRVGKNPGFLMSGARIKQLQGDSRTAGIYAVQAVKLLDANRPELMVAWFSDMRRIQTDRVRLLQFLETTEDIGITPEWMNYFRGRLYVEVKPAVRPDEQPQFNGTDMAKGEQILRSLSRDATSQPVRNLSHRALGESRYLRRDWAGAAEEFMKGVEAFPSDWELKNNVAYIYTRYLDRPQDALELCEQASAVSENNPDVLDTLGLTYLRLNRPTDALEPLRRSRLLARNTGAFVSSSLHYAEALFRTGTSQNKTDARSVVVEARQAFESLPAEMADFETKAELDRVDRLVNQ